MSWFWLSSLPPNEKWTPYDKHISDTISEAKLLGKLEVVIQTPVGPYVVSLLDPPMQYPQGQSNRVRAVKLEGTISQEIQERARSIMASAALLPQPSSFGPMMTVGNNLQFTPGLAGAQPLAGAPPLAATFTVRPNTPGNFQPNYAPQPLTVATAANSSIFTTPGNLQFPAGPGAFPNPPSPPTAGHDLPVFPINASSGSFHPPIPGSFHAGQKPALSHSSPNVPVGIPFPALAPSHSGELGRDQLAGSIKAVFEQLVFGSQNNFGFANASTDGLLLQEDPTGNKLNSVCQSVSQRAFNLTSTLPDFAPTVPTHPSQLVSCSTHVLLQSLMQWTSNSTIITLTNRHPTLPATWTVSDFCLITSEYFLNCVPLNAAGKYMTDSQGIIAPGASVNFSITVVLVTDHFIKKLIHIKVNYGGYFSSVIPICVAIQGFANVNTSIKYWQIEKGALDLIKEIGAGAFGAVYSCNVKGFVGAVKLWFHPMKQVQPDFHSELDVLCNCRHSNLVPFFGGFQETGSGGDARSFLVMKFATYGSLHHYYSKDPPAGVTFDYQWALKMALGVARGIKYLHERNIIHRDIKSLNILVAEDGEPLVNDFGAAKSSKSTTNTLIVGTPGWVAPEVISDKTYNKPADVFSFGILLWELIVRKLPARTEDEYKSGKKMTLPAEFTAAHPDYSQLMDVCCDTDPKIRPTFVQLDAILSKMLMMATSAAPR